MGDELFSELVGEDVKPIAVEKRVALSKARDADVDKEIRRQAAQEIALAKEDPLATQPVTMVEPRAELSFRRPGVQHGVFKNLRQGKYALDARLDLHKMTVEHARAAVHHFVKDCMANDVRCALITHGMGEGREQPAMLKSCVAHWLPQMDEVLAFHTAQKQHGSYGATYVLFKKSERLKAENRELNRGKGS